MYPRLFTLPAFHLFGWDLGPLTLHTYGVLLALAFLAGLFVVSSQAKKARARRGADHGHGGLGAHRRPAWGPRSCWWPWTGRYYLADELARALAIFQSGGVFYGGLLGGLAGGRSGSCGATSCPAGPRPTCWRREW